MLNILPFTTNSKLARVLLIHSGYKAHQDLALASYPVTSVKEHNRKGENDKSLGFYNRLFSSPLASPRVEASDRPKQAQHLSTCKWKLQQGLSASRVMGDVNRPVRLLPLHSHPPSSWKYLTQSLEWIIISGEVQTQTNSGGSISWATNTT